MGKTGTTNWCQVKGVKGQIRLVPQKDAEVKKPGPNQRYKSNAVLKKISKRAESDDSRRGGRPGGRPGGSRPPARGGRGGRRGSREDMVDKRVRRRMTRPKSSVLGSKQKAKK